MGGRHGFVCTCVYMYVINSLRLFFRQPLGLGEVRVEEERPVQQAGRRRQGAHGHHQGQKGSPVDRRDSIGQFSMRDSGKHGCRFANEPAALSICRTEPLSQTLTSYILCLDIAWKKSLLKDRPRPFLNVDSGFKKIMQCAFPASLQ